MNEESKENIQKQESTEIAIVDSGTIRDKIYVVRGVQVMLDFELAELYGYETKNFNRQVKNNAEKFEGDDFMFQLTKDEIDNILRCKNFTSCWGGTRYLPYAFTEQGLFKISNKPESVYGVIEQHYNTYNRRSYVWRKNMMQHWQ